MDDTTTKQNIEVPISVFITYSVVIPILCIGGIVGNSLSIVILSRNTFKKNIVYAYLKGKCIRRSSKRVNYRLQ